jgi:hypothetical protein
MERRFRVLRFLALIYQILAWIVLVAGILAAVGVVVLGATAGRGRLPVIPGMPVLPGVGGLVGGITAGLAALLGALFYFVLLYAAGELIHLGLAIEENTRETAYYLRGEAAIPSPPEPAR